MSKTEFVVDKENLEVRLSRTFNATPERMWQAHTVPEQIEQWWADTKVDKFELRVGGQWRFVSAGEMNGKPNAFRGEFKVLDEPNRIVRTFEYEPFAGSIMTETVIFEPLEGGKTKQITVSKYLTEQQLEGMVHMGMEKGAEAGLDRLAKVVEES